MKIINKNFFEKSIETKKFFPYNQTHEMEVLSIMLFDSYQGGIIIC
jgi:hypothetical protein